MNQISNRKQRVVYTRLGGLDISHAFRRNV